MQLSLPTQQGIYSEGGLKSSWLPGQCEMDRRTEPMKLERYGSQAMKPECVQQFPGAEHVDASSTHFEDRYRTSGGSLGTLWLQCLQAMQNWAQVPVHMPLSLHL